MIVAMLLVLSRAARAIVLLSLAAPSLQSHNRAKKDDILMDAMLQSSGGTSQVKRRAKPDAGVGSPPLCFPFETVDHDFVLKHASFLPDPAQAAPGACKDSATYAFRNHLMRLAAPEKCVASKQMTTDNVGYGFGSVINSWTKVRRGTLTARHRLLLLHSLPHCSWSCTSESFDFGFCIAMWYPSLQFCTCFTAVHARRGPRPLLLESSSWELRGREGREEGRAQGY